MSDRKDPWTLLIASSSRASRPIQKRFKATQLAYGCLLPYKERKAFPAQMYDDKIIVSVLLTQPAAQSSHPIESESLDLKACQSWRNSSLHLLETIHPYLQGESIPNTYTLSTTSLYDASTRCNVHYHHHHVIATEIGGSTGTGQSLIISSLRPHRTVACLYAWGCLGVLILGNVKAVRR